MRALLLSLVCATATAAPQVSLNGSLGRSAALLVIEGQIKTVRLGQTVDGVRLLEVGDGSALVEVEGRRLQLRLGAANVAQGGGAGAGGSRIVLQASSGGHFMASGSINGRAVNFMIDTGATTVALGQAEAERLGLRYQNGRRVMMQTANGPVPAHLITVDRVRIGDVELSGVAATVSPVAMPYVLLGNSFLSRFQMRRENDQLTLDKRF